MARPHDDARRRLAVALAVLTRPSVRFAVLVLVMGAFAVALLATGGLSRARIEHVVLEAGPLAPILYVLLYAVLTVALVPGSVVTAVGGLVFGVVGGTLLTLLGATLGASAAFGLARWLGRDQLERLTRGWMGRLDRWLDAREFMAVLLLRLIPVVPFNLVNYLLGLTSVHARPYVMATALGILPGTFAFAALGSNVTEPTSPAFLGALALLVALLVGGAVVDRCSRRRANDRASDEVSTNGTDTSPHEELDR